MKGFSTKHLFGLLGLILPLGAITFGAPARAIEAPTQVNPGLSVTPAIIEPLVRPGVETRIQLRVTNLSATALPINVVPRAFELLESAGSELAATYDASKWIRVVGETPFLLAPTQSRDVELIIQPPLGTEPGGHYATIYFEPLVPQEGQAQNVVSLAPRVGSLAFLVVPGDAAASLSLAQPLSTKSFARRGPLDFSFALENKGTIHTLPTVSLRIKNLWGRTVATLQPPPGVVLPGITKTYRLQWPERRPLGWYRAELSVSYGPQHSQLASSTRFLAFPVTDTALGATVLVGLLAGLFMIRRRLFRAWRVLRGRN